MNKVQIAVVGAGLAGLVCAKRLQEEGLDVLVLDKSRGVGGRVATRRLADTRVDHGLPYLENAGDLISQLMKELIEKEILHFWTDKSYELTEDGELEIVDTKKRYIASHGMSECAKYLASNLNIQRESRVTLIKPSPDSIWEITCEPDSRIIHANILVLAIPAPQASMLLQPLETTFPSDFSQQLNNVSFNPCITVIANYNSRSFQDFLWQPIECNHGSLAQVILDSSKRETKDPSVFILHSTPKFAQKHLEAVDLSIVGEQLLSVASQLLFPWFNQPEWYQVHRWRYATPLTPLSAPYLATETPLPLICCGDWCGGNGVESALESGQATANKVLSFI